jgi:hypothetical protein
MKKNFHSERILIMKQKRISGECTHSSTIIFGSRKIIHQIIQIRYGVHVYIHVYVHLLYIVSKLGNKFHSNLIIYFVRYRGCVSYDSDYRNDHLNVGIVMRDTVICAIIMYIISSELVYIITCV